MKKLGLVLGFLLVAVVAKADPLCTNWGDLNLCLPLTQLDAAYGYNFAAPEGTSGNQALLETQIASYKSVYMTFGGAKSESTPAAPYIGIAYGIKNPIEDTSNFFNVVRPGVYAGRDFSNGSWIYGLKAVVSIF